jgi:hypothetical protein
MADNPAQSPSTPPVPAGDSPVAQNHSGLMLPILLGVLLVVVGWFAYDQFFAKAYTNAADEAIGKLADGRNQQSITGPDGKRVSEGRVVSDDIQKLLGRAPSSVKKEKQYTLETYWWYSMPHRNYIVVLYLGNEPRRYHAHYLNRYPDVAELPIDLELPPAQPNSDETPNADSQKQDKAESAPAKESAPAIEDAAKDAKATDADTKDAKAKDSAAKDAEAKDAKPAAP